MKLLHSRFDIADDVEQIKVKIAIFDVFRTVFEILLRDREKARSQFPMFSKFQKLSCIDATSNFTALKDAIARLILEGDRFKLIAEEYLLKN